MKFSNFLSTAQVVHSSYYLSADRLVLEPVCSALYCTTSPISCSGRYNDTLSTYICGITSPLYAKCEMFLDFRHLNVLILEACNLLSLNAIKHLPPAVQEYGLVPLTPQSYSPLEATGIIIPVFSMHHKV